MSVDKLVTPIVDQLPTTEARRLHRAILSSVVIRRAARSADRNAKDPHVVAACDHAGLFRREAAAQHRSDKLYPLRVVLQAAGPDLLVAADADVIHADNVGHLLEPFDILFEAREKVPIPTDPPVSAIARA